MTAPQPALTRDQLGELQHELQRTLNRLERSLSVNGGSSPELDQSAVGRLSRIEALQNQGLTRNLHDRERLKLELVLEALKRLENGTYGFCASCRKPIRYERLLVFPEARTCTGCSDGQ